MSRRNYTIKIHPGEPDEGGYWVEVPALPGCVTEADTYDEALAMAAEAIELYLESLKELGQPIPVDHPAEAAEVVLSVNLPARV